MVNPGFQEIRILIVDDDADDALLLKRYIQKGMKQATLMIDHAASFLETISRIENARYDVCFFDYRLGEMDGLQLMERVRANGVTTPIIFLTGQGDEVLVAAAMKAGACDYLPKGKLSPELVCRSIQRALELHKTEETRRETEQRLDHLAHFDVLTGLPNRMLFFDRLSQALVQARRNHDISALLFLDLDGFKFVNDTLGHDVGDLLLKEAARRLSKCARESDTVARIGGDEFAIILLKVAKAEDATVVARRVIASLSGPFHLKSHECAIGVSIGISLYPADGDERETLLKSADIAMYQVKEQGGNAYQFFNSAMNARFAKRMTMENNLREALEREEFRLQYQPLVDIKTGQITGMEALVRWQSPEVGLVPPGEFIPVAEEIGLIIPIGEWVLRSVCAQNKAWRDAGLQPLRISVNLSGRQLKQENLIETVAQVLQKTGLSSSCLTLELTESTAMHNAEAAIMTLRELHAMGIQIWIDGFGTGYSSLRCLKRLPIQKLKIDKSLIRAITISPDDAAVVTATIAMAHSLKLQVIAEGVETVEQLNMLRLLKCDEAQGSLFSRALPAEEATRLLRKERPVALFPMHTPSTRRSG